MSPAQEQLHARLRAMDVADRDVVLFMLCGSAPALVAAALERFEGIPPVRAALPYADPAGTAGHCPICSRPLADDGSHIAPSGAHIPAGAA